MKILGIIGGLGPMATAYFMQLLTQMSEAVTDQQHMELLIHSKPSIPDRTQYILGNSHKSPLPAMQEIGRELAAQGAQLLAIPCITAHYFQQELEKAAGIPVLHAIDETADYLRAEGIQRAGIMATDGTVASRLFQDRLKAFDIEAIVPPAKEQEQIMKMIYKEVKAGIPISRPVFEAVADCLFEQGAEVNLLGCTELSIIKRDNPLSAGFVDVMEVLARKAVQECGQLKVQYRHLIT